MGEERREQDKEILGPLMRAKCFDERFQGPGAFLKGARGDDALCTQFHAQSSTRIRDHGFSGACHHGKIWRVVPDVGEVDSAEELAEAVEFPAAGHVLSAIAGKDFIEESEMIGNAARELGVGAGGEIDFAAPRILLLKILKKFSVIGEMRHVKDDVFGNKCLEGRFAVKDHAGQAQQEQGMSSRQHEKRVDQSVRFDQSSIQVDAEGREFCRSGFRLGLDLRQP